ncbi:MAG: hypothetical protein WC564_02590 [Patescibacteria group bacterium]
MFEKFNYYPDQIQKYYQAAVRDLHLAILAEAPEIIFYLSYNIIIKMAIAVCAKNNLRVKSRVGHHIELIAKLAEYLDDQEIEDVANKMRTKRNRDLYDGGVITSEKEAEFYICFCKKLVERADRYLSPDKLL